jgi:hypothetical protein
MCWAVGFIGTDNHYYEVIHNVVNGEYYWLKSKDKVNVETGRQEEIFGTSSGNAI